MENLCLEKGLMGSVVNVIDYSKKLRTQKMSLPTIDVSPLITDGANKLTVGREIHQACREYGFFYIVGHDIPVDLQGELESISRQFFNLPEDKKLQIAMEKGGRAWRGYFTVGSELTSGRPDLKEGLYFGEELPLDDVRVKSGMPLHGGNLFPDIPGFKQTILDYLRGMRQLGHAIMKGIALSLQLPENHFEESITSDPLILFRIFNYPAESSILKPDVQWGVGEHTDYGVLTILKQDSVGGLQVLSNENWINAPYLENSFVCNIGDMLDKMTGGYYKSTPHRVLSNPVKSRLSFPFFFDPNFNAIPGQIDLSHLEQHQTEVYKRWDNADIQAYSGTYGNYLLNKIGKVFPWLSDNLN